ncbi:MAG: hypothetical protein LBL39_02455 [Planctomycetaceae bacterium]|jgi:hypothetical protein|nr:hypothetical protein [Planctomycetaceae bacterium]
MDNPVQVLRSTGSGHLLNRNYVVVQQRKFIFAVNVLNCYAVLSIGGAFTPCCPSQGNTVFARGYPHSSPTDLEIASKKYHPYFKFSCMVTVFLD